MVSSSVPAARCDSRPFSVVENVDGSARRLSFPLALPPETYSRRRRATMPCRAMPMAAGCAATASSDPRIHHHDAVRVEAGVQRDHRLAVGRRRDVEHHVLRGDGPAQRRDAPAVGERVASRKRLGNLLRGSRDCEKQDRQAHKRFQNSAPPLQIRNCQESLTREDPLDGTQQLIRRDRLPDGGARPHHRGGLEEASLEGAGHRHDADSGERRPELANGL